MNQFANTLFNEYGVFTTAFAYILAGNFQAVLTSIIDNLLYPLIYQGTGWLPDDDMKTELYYKGVINSILRFSLTVAVVYVAYIYRESIVGAIKN